MLVSKVGTIGQKETLAHTEVVRRVAMRQRKTDMFACPAWWLLATYPQGFSQPILTRRVFGFLEYFQR